MQRVSWIWRLGLLGVLTGLSCNSARGDRPEESPPRGDGNCVNTCLDNSDPEPVDCEAAEEGVEFYPTPIWDFEGFASNLYSYTDGAVDFMRAVTGRNEDGSVQYNENQGTRLLGFQPEVRRLQRCKGEEDANDVLHLQGGPFLNWGGGIGRHLKCMNSNQGNMYAAGEITIGDQEVLNKGCDGADSPRACESDEDSLAYTACPKRDRNGKEGVPEGEEFMWGMTLDLTRWDGISFWARRSNDSQPGIRVALGDKYTDDDLSYLQYHINPDDKRFCERNQECGCTGNTTCTDGACYDPRYDEVEPLEDEWLSAVSLYDGEEFSYIDEENRSGYPQCGQYLCQRGFRAFRTLDGTNPREDVAFKGTGCHPFTFRGGITENYCYDPENGPTPYENSQLCGDHWLKPVRLSTEWQFYKVPFSELLQQGWAKESFHLDLTSAGLFRFIWGRGWIDYMFDDVRFYRNKHTK